MGRVTNPEAEQLLRRIDDLERHLERAKERNNELGIIQIESDLSQLYQQLDYIQEQWGDVDPWR